MNRQKIIAVFLIFLLVGTQLATVVSAGFWGKLGGTVWDFAKEEHGEFSRIGAYLIVLFMFYSGIQNDLTANLRSYIVDNPNVTTPSVMDAMGFFILNVQVAYILAIVGTGAYMLLSSHSPRARAKSKYLIGKLIIGFLLVTVSPFIMQMFLSFSSSITATVIDAENPQIAADTFSDLLFKCWYASGAVLVPQITIEFGGIHLIFHKVLHPLEHANKAAAWFKVLEKVKINPKPDFTFPFLMTQMFFILMLYGMLSMRLILIMTWVVLFPITIFFMTFEPTKGIGKAMIEQTIFWTILQVFYAVSIDVIAVGFSALPTGLDYFGLGAELSIVDLTLSFFTIGACLMLVLTPLFTLSLYQRLTS
jgi:hypothetical protein